MRRVLIVTAAVVAAVIVFVLATLPPRPQRVDTSAIDPELIRRTVRGAYHVHTTRSDGASDKATIAAAAARAALNFVIFTDHGDGTAPADQPVYLSGVLCVDAVEISTNGGHYVALGMRQAPYPLGGDPAAVVEDVARLGGFGIAAHPDSPKASLAWTDWDAPIDGIEWLSADSEWRDESRLALVHAFVSYLFRPAPALASLLDRPVTTLRRWDALTRQRRVVALAAHDAHGGIGRGMEEGGARKPALGHVPSYEASFRTFTTQVVLPAALTGDASTDGRAVVDAIRHGSVYTVIDAIATPGFIDIRGDQRKLVVNATLPAAGQLVAFDNGSEILHRVHSSLGIGSATGPVRAEVFVAKGLGPSPIPWILANPIYFTSPAVLSSPAPPRALEPLASAFAWHVEKDPRSAATIEPGGQGTVLRYTLASGERSSQFVALVVDVKGSLPICKQVILSGSAASPARVSVQFRYSQGGGERWGRSVYLDSVARDVVVSVDDMRPLDRQGGRPPATTGVASVLFVIDLTNARPGDTNAIRIANVRLGR